MCGSHQVLLDYGQTKHVWYTQHFSIPRSSSYTHQVSDCHSNLVPIPASSIDLTSKSVHYLSLPFLCRIFLILDKLKIEMTKDSLHHAAKNGEYSCVENFHGDNLNPHNINKLSCTHQSLQETQHLCHPEHFSSLLDLNIIPPKYISCIQQLCKDNIQQWTQPLRS